MTGRTATVERFVDVSSGHAAIEQVNRLLSGVIGVPTLLLAISAFRVRPRVIGLRWPAIGVLVSVLANGVVGGVAVRTDLHPALVQSHFLLAMVSDCVRCCRGASLVEQRRPSQPHNKLAQSTWSAHRRVDVAHRRRTCDGYRRHGHRTPCGRTGRAPVRFRHLERGPHPQRNGDRRSRRSRPAGMDAAGWC